MAAVPPRGRRTRRCSSPTAASSTSAGPCAANLALARRPRRDRRGRCPGRRDRRDRDTAYGCAPPRATSKPNGWSCAPAHGRRGCCERTLGIRWPIRLTHEQVTYFATPQPARSRRTGSRSGSGTATRSSTASRCTERTRPRRRRRSAASPVDIDTWDWQPDQRPGRDGSASSSNTSCPGTAGPELYTRCCLYDMPPDRDFVIDTDARTRAGRSLHRCGPRGEVRRHCSAEYSPSSPSTAATDCADRAVPRRPPGAGRRRLRAGIPVRRRRIALPVGTR